MRPRKLLLSLAVTLAALFAGGGCRALDHGEAEARLEEAERAGSAKDAPAFDAALEEAVALSPPADADLRARAGGACLRVALLERDPARVRTLRQRGAALLDEALALRPDASAWRFDRGACALLLGDAEGAVRELERVRRRAPADDEARRLLARAYLAAGDDRAAADLLEGPSPAAHERERLELLGAAQLLLGEAPRAEASFTRALEASGPPPRAVEARLRYHRGLAREARGDRPLAREDFAAALRLAPEHARAKERLATLE